MYTKYIVSYMIGVFVGNIYLKYDQKRKTKAKNARWIEEAKMYDEYN
jgi:hypothetical protein